MLGHRQLQAALESRFCRLVVFGLSVVLRELAQGAHGLMVEVHPEPDKATSDGRQSLDFRQFTALYKKLLKTVEFANKLQGGR